MLEQKFNLHSVHFKESVARSQERVVVQLFLLEWDEAEKF